MYFYVYYKKLDLHVKVSADTIVKNNETTLVNTVCDGGRQNMQCMNASYLILYAEPCYFNSGSRPFCLIFSFHCKICHLFWICETEVQWTVCSFSVNVWLQKWQIPKAVPKLLSLLPKNHWPCHSDPWRTSVSHICVAFTYGVLFITKILSNVSRLFVLPSLYVDLNSLWVYKFRCLHATILDPSTHRMLRLTH